MNNDIMKFLNIEDKDIIICKILIDGNTKEIHLEKVLKVEFCPSCSSKIHSNKNILSIYLYCCKIIFFSMFNHLSF